jgi:hypothetical protein
VYCDAAGIHGLRSGLVLGPGGGVLGRLALPARPGALPRFGDMFARDRRGKAETATKGNLET